MINSYSNVNAIGHKSVGGIFSGPIVIQEKIDGSQFSFGIYDGKLWCRSKNCQIDPETIAPNDMFVDAVEVVKNIAHKLINGYTYRCEYLRIPKHNTLRYERVPKNHLVLFDIDKGLQDYVDMQALRETAIFLGLDPVPVYYEGRGDAVVPNNFLTHTSILGGPIEGIVIKNYNQFGNDKKILCAKLVNEQFKETHTKEWKKAHPQSKDIITAIGSGLVSTARWEKAIQHLREMGTLQNAPQDIPLILKEINQDVLKECEDEIKEMLFKWAWKDISRLIIRGFPEWYKQKLIDETLGVNHVQQTH